MQCEHSSISRARWKKCVESWKGYFVCEYLKNAPFLATLVVIHRNRLLLPSNVGVAYTSPVLAMVFGERVIHPDITRFFTVSMWTVTATPFVSP